MKSKRSNKILITFFALLLVMHCSKETPVQPEKTITEKLQQCLNNIRESYHVKGASACVIIPGEEIWLGMSGISYGAVPISSDMVFCGGSVTKSYMGALILQLAEEGVLSLEDSLYEWLPVFPHIDSTITIRQLLNHSSGLFDYNEHPTIWSTIGADLTRHWSPEEIITSFISNPYCSPGTEFHYSNTGYVLLGMIVETATGSNVSVQLRNRFFTPLQLNYTFLASEEVVTVDFAHGWFDLNNDGVLDDVVNIPLTAFHSLTWTAGDIVCSAADLAKWTKALLEGEIFSPSSLDQMLTFSFPPQTDMYTGYGLGLGQLGPFFVRDAQAFGHAGDWFGYAAVMVYLPESGVSYAVMINEVDADCLGSISNEFIDIIENYLSSE